MAIQIAGNQVKNAAIDSNQISDGAIDASKIDLTGTFVFSGPLRAGTPSNSADVVTKQYVDGLVGSGVFWKEPAKVASVNNENLSNPATATFDGVTISSGDRILIRAQTTASENGVYVFNGSGSAMTRSTDCNSAVELNGAALFVTDGSSQNDQAFVQTATISSLGSDTVTWVRFSGTGTIEAGAAMSKTGDRLDVVADNSTIEINSDALRVKDLGITNDKLAGSISASKLAGSIGDSLLNTISTGGKVSGSAVQLNGSGGLANSSGLKIDNAGVSNAMLAGSIADSKMLQIVTADKVAGSAVELASSGGLANDSGLKIDSASVSDAMLAGNISAGKLAGNIPDSKLQNIASAGKVLGSSVQLAGSGGLANDGGLKIDAASVTDAMLAGSISDGKLLNIVSSNKVQGSSVQLAGSGGLANASGLKIDTDGVVSAMIGPNAVNSAKINFEPKRETLSTNGNTTSFNLATSVPDGFSEVAVFRNGLFVDRVASSPSGQDEFTSTINGGTCTIVFGTAPAGSDKVVVQYFGLK